MAIFRVEIEPAATPVGGEIAQLVMDDPDRTLNVIGEPALADLERALADLEARPGLRGVIVRSGKAGSFVAGADVERIDGIRERAEAHAIVTRAQAAFSRLAALHCPTVAAIDGVCLGGGLELALACDSRIAADEPRTRIGLPEVLLGIIPGFGGTSRLPRLVGLSTALDLILSGRALDARRAERAGLVARAVPGVWLVDEARRRLGELAARPPGRDRVWRDRFRPRTFASRLVDGTMPGRGLALSRARGMTRARTGGHYPAPIAALNVIDGGYGRPLEVSLRLEAEWVSDLVVSPVCKNLVRLFRLGERARKERLVGEDPLAPAPRRMLVVGAGVMGAGIAELAIREGVEVRLRDVDPAALARGLRAVRDRVLERARRAGRSRRRGAARPEADAQLARILPSLDLAGAKRADFAIEAVIEDLDVKRRVFGELEVRMRPDALLATNTSSLSVDELASGLEHPQRFVGLHFFNPVHRMPLVEVVRGSRSSDAAVAAVVAFARRLGKTPVVVRDAPGFAVNRVLMPYLREALHLLEDGYTVRDVDASMRAFGMPMGPLEVVDEVGLDVAAKVAEILSRAFPERMSPAPQIEALVVAGRLGRKSGLGFYRHEGSRRRPDPRARRLLGLTRERKPPSLEALAERMALAMVNEAAHCLADGVVGDAGMLDLALVYGAGFPPFRGGPLRYADSLGLAKVEARLTALRAEKGERFRPAPLITELAARGGTFTSAPAD